MVFSNQGDSVVLVGDLLNFHGDALDRILEQVFRACVQSVNLQHFNRNSIVDEDFVQFTLEHTDFVDYVFSSRNVKVSQLRYETLVGGVVNWLNNLAQSDRQMNIDNDWAISLQVSRTTETPRGFGNEDKLEADVNVTMPESVFDQNVLDVNIPRLNADVDALPPDDDEEERLFGPMSEDEDNDDDSEAGEEDCYDEDSGTCNVVYQNNVALQVFIDKEIESSLKIVDYYVKGNVHNTSLRNECLLISISVHHMHLIQPNNFKRLMYREGSWLTQRMTERLLQIVRELDKKFGRNENGRGHWDEIEFIRKILSTGDGVADFSKDNSKLPVLKFRRDNSSKEISNYPMYVLKHSVDNKNHCKIEKLFSCGDNGVFSSNRPCVLLLRNDHFYNVWGHDSLFDDVNNPRIGSKRKCGSSPRYKKLFCLHCIVFYANDHLHICKGRCHHCLGTTEDHETNDFKEFFCEDCGRCFCQESCFESPKTKKLNGGYETYCLFFHMLRTCNEYRHEFSLSIKCCHFGKTNNKRQHRNIYFSNYSSKEYCGPSKYVKCGYCSDFYVKGFSGNHACFLRNSDSIFGDVKKRSKTMHSHSVFFMTLKAD